MKLKAETIIKLNKFSPRSYQVPIVKALEKDKFKKILAILPRRSGKDLLAWNLLIRAAITEIGVYFYCLPTFRQAKLVIWDSITNQGDRFIDYIPKELITSTNSQEMKIRLINGSLIQLIGSDTYDTSLVGTNPKMVIFSEWALSDKRAYSYVRPILNANGGSVIFLTTPRGHNHAWELYQIVKDFPDWFVYKLTLEDTKHISINDIEKDVHDGVMSLDMVQQEYYCFPQGQQVLTKNGIVDIKDISVNDMVFSHSGRLRKVSEIISRDYEGQLIEINSYGSNDPIICTPNHPIRIYNQSSQSYSWKEAKDITEEDKLVFPKILLGDIKIIDYELCMLIAWFITEGSCFKNGVQWTVILEESYIIGKYLTALEIPWASYENGPVINVVVNSTQLVDFFKSTCGLQANDKRIPFHLISGYEEQFFYELIKGDGCYNISKNCERYCFTTVSKSLAYQIQLLANSLNLGYAAGITTRPAHQGNIKGRDVNCQESYQINISFPGLHSTGKLIRAKYCIAAKVKSIDAFNFKGKVYNLSVQYDESYLVAGRAVHNCSFDLGIEGAFYSKYIDRMKLNGQISEVPWENGHKVHTSWDLGMRDSTTIIFFQTIGQTVRVIDCYENANYGLDHYAKVLQNKPYQYGKHIAPHDIKVRELGTGMTRLEKARELGISFTIAPDISVIDGIESVRSALSKVWIDEQKGKPLLKALENYRREYDDKKKIYGYTPLHDWSSHFSDSMRYLCISLPKTRDGLSPEDLDKRYKEAMYGPHGNLPAFFRD